MINNNAVKWGLYAGGAAMALCLVAMIIGGSEWGTASTGWIFWLSLLFSGVVGAVIYCVICDREKEDWLADRRDVIDRLKDAQMCIKSEEKAHEFTKRQLRDANAKITQEHAEAQRYLKQYNEANDAQEAMRIRCGQRDGVIKELRVELEEIRQQIQTDNDTWRKQVSNMREAAYKLAVHIEGSASGLPDEWEAWGAELAQDLRKLAGAGGVTADERQIPIEGTTTVEAEIESAIEYDGGPVRTVTLPPAQTQPTPIHIAHSLMAKARENQAQRRANLDVICHAVEHGYELSDAFTAAYHRGMIWVTDELIAKERGYIEHSQPSE